jgi:Cys-rich repeat protein
MKPHDGRAKFWISVISACLAGCGQPQPEFRPPLLMDQAGLADWIPLANSTLLLDTAHQDAFPTGQRFQAHVLAVAGSSQLVIEASAKTSVGLALYGPRRSDGLFGFPLAWRQGTRVRLAGLELERSGDYLLLVADLERGAGAYQLVSRCTGACGPPVCPALICGIYCPTGLASGSGCPECACATGCANDLDCPAGTICEPTSGVCRRPENECLATCQDQPYQPVCGLDEVSYANPCELACAGALQDHAGPCLPPACSADSDCAAGMRCAAGVCQVAACDCSRAGYDPVCGRDGLTYPNDCERQCAQVGLQHQGPCDQCIPESCGDGLDNDCDGLVDEDCSGSCLVDSDCPASLLCMAGSCSAGLPCASQADCPADQQCDAGLCRPEPNCIAEVCDGQDNDCDGQVDEDFDLQTDPDHCGQCGTQCAQDEACLAGDCTLVVSCNSDADCPAGQVCVNGVCAPDVCEEDIDGDGYPTIDCGGPDCDDADASVHPDATELCDGLDNNCDGQIDENCPPVCASDADCAAGQVCISGLCWLGCLADSDCQASEICFNGACRLSCAADSDCPASWHCDFNQRACVP